MIVEQQIWTDSASWSAEGTELADRTAVQFVTVFGDSDLVSQPSRYSELKEFYPNAHLMGCSTSGNIIGTEVADGCVVATAVVLEKSHARLVAQPISGAADSFAAGAAVVQELASEPGLRHVFVLSDGLNVNGTDLARGANSVSVPDVIMTGGLAGDGSNFAKTWVLADGPAKPNLVAALGLYGDELLVGHGCRHGWEIFGIERKVTKAKDNVVYEIDGEPALALYKRYLGEEHASGLPASGLRFPLSVQLDSTRPAVVRTLLASDEESQSLTFAGAVPEGKVALLMKTNMDGLVDAAREAAEDARVGGQGDGVCLAVSCVGRRLVLTKLVEEEVEAVQEVLGHRFRLTGYYSYGELAPQAGTSQCDLHNQTMTLTTIAEA